uniref:Apple domain-containing protein n=1 Tax=Ascaris lumbricoides TaxID=6252 RepID=A0A9J2PAE3_ASCLU
MNANAPEHGTTCNRQQHTLGGLMMHFPGAVSTTARMFQVLLLLSAFLIICLDARSPYMRCFRKTVRRSIDNAQPMLELFYVTSYQCIDQCIFATNNNAPNARLCRSFVYDRSQHSCRLYDHDGNQPPSILHPADGYDYYKRTAILNQCSGPVAPMSSSSVIQLPSSHNLYAVKVTSTGDLPWRSQNYGSESSERSKLQIVERQYGTSNSEHTRIPHLQHADESKQLSGHIIPKLFGEKAKKEGPKQLDALSSLVNDRTKDASSEVVPRGRNQLTNLAESNSEFDYKRNRNPTLVVPRKLITTATPTVDNELIFEDEGTINAHASQVPVSTHMTQSVEPIESDSLATTSMRGVSRRSQCSASTGYYIFIGSKMVLHTSSNENDVIVVEGVDQSQCARYCSANERPTGEPKKCSSMNYFPLSQKCELHSVLAAPHGPGNLVENDDVIYGEKFCLPVGIVNCHDGEMFVLFVNKKLASQEFDVLSANSVTMCLQHCLESGRCNSAAFDSNSRRCYLHDVNIADSPSAMKNASAGWVVIENGCNTYARHQLQQNSSSDSEDMVALREAQWTEWSDCQFRFRGRLVRARTRRCEGECAGGSLQVEPCN